MEKTNDKPLYKGPGDFVPKDGHADWNPDEYEPDVAEFMGDQDFDHEAGAVAGQAVEEGLRDLTQEEEQSFLNYVKPSVNRNYQAQAGDPYEGAAHPGEGQAYYDLEDARDRIATRSAGLSSQAQRLISQRMSLAMSVFGHEAGAPHLPWDVLDAIMYGTKFVSSNGTLLSDIQLRDIHIPVDLPEKTKKQLEKAITYLLSIPDAKFWRNMAIATKKVGLTPLDGAMFMNVTIGMFSLHKPFVWDFENDRLPYIHELVKQVHESKQGEKLYNFFTKIISFKYKDKPIPRSVSATLARDAFCLLYVEL